MTAEEMKLSMQRTWVNNKWNKYIPTHFIVWCTWDFVKVNDLDIAVWSTQDAQANLDSINIEVVGDFNKNLPTEAQYNMTRTIISRILEKHPWMEIKRHWDFQPKNCPWVNFDMSRLTNITSPKPVYRTILTWLDLKLMNQVCKVWINGRTSPLCHNDHLFLRLKKQAQETWSWYDLFKLQLGSSYKESHLWTNFVSASGYLSNNWWWMKWKINSDCTREPANYYPWTNLYAFSSVEESFKSQGYLFKCGYFSKWMMTPKQISGKYVTWKVWVKESRYPAVNTFYYIK